MASTQRWGPRLRATAYIGESTASIKLPPLSSVACFPGERETPARRAAAAQRMRRSTTSPHPAPLPLNCEHAALSSHDATERHAHLQTRHMAVTVLSADVVNALQYGLHPTLARPRRPPKRYKDGNRPCFAMHDGKPTTVKVWAAAPGHRPSSYAVACHIGISECRTEPEINWELLPEFCCDVDDPVPHAASPSGLVRPMWSGNLMTASPLFIRALPRGLPVLLSAPTTPY